MIQKIWIKNVRNLTELTIDLSTKKHCFIVGNNNQGKTSILEAIHLGVETKSPIQDDIEKVIQDNQKECFIGLDIGDLDNESTKERRYIRLQRNGKKEFVKNSKKSTKKQFQSYFTEYISADALHIFQKDPDYRRKILDKFCAILNPEYEVFLKRYEKLLRQKNKYLKQECCDNQFIRTLNMQLADLGAFIVLERHNALFLLEETINKTKHDINLPFDKIAINYIQKRLEDCPKELYKETFFETLTNDVEKEKILKYSLSGPHRDDFCFKVNDKDIFDYYSRGINRSFAILFRIAQIECCREKKMFACILLDDAFAEVDRENTEKIVNFIKPRYQLFYATTQKDSVFYDVTKNAMQQMIEIKQGVITCG